MKRTPLVLFMLLLSCMAIYAFDYATAARKARRFFEHREWASASAMYDLMLDHRPYVADTYSYAIVSAAMRADSADEMRLLEQAMHNSIPFDSVMNGVFDVALASGNIETHEEFLLNAQQCYPWLARAIDRFLLDYYCFRNDGVRMVRYSNLLLEGLPDNIEFMTTLAQGYLLNGEADSAITIYRRVIELDPDNFNALVSVGNYCVSCINDAPEDCVPAIRQEARAMLQHAYALKPTPFVAKILKNL